MKNIQILLFVCLLLFSCFGEKPEPQKSEETFLPGLEAVDIHGNFTKIGFKLTKNLSSSTTFS